LATIIPVPTLSTQGFVRDSSGKFDFLLSHYFLSDYNQTYLYYGRVSSLPRIIERSGSDIGALLTDLKQNLFDYLAKYYDSVSVDVNTTTDIVRDPRTDLELRVIISVAEDGKQTVFGRLLRSENSKLTDIVKLNNY
jgi:hypothetical protein